MLPRLIIETHLSLHPGDREPSLNRLRSRDYKMLSKTLQKQIKITPWLQQRRSKWNQDRKNFSFVSDLQWVASLNDVYDDDDRLEEASSWFMLIRRSFPCSKMRSRLSLFLSWRFGKGFSRIRANLSKVRSYTLSPNDDHISILEMILLQFRGLNVSFERIYSCTSRLQAAANRQMAARKWDQFFASLEFLSCLGYLKLWRASVTIWRAAAAGFFRRYVFQCKLEMRVSVEYFI